MLLAIVRVYTYTVENENKIKIIMQPLFYLGHVQSSSWIGLKDTGSNNYQWMDGEQLTKTNWHSGFPNGNPCVYMLENGEWIDDNCNSNYNRICKKDESNELRYIIGVVHQSDSKRNNPCLSLLLLCGMWLNKVKSTFSGLAGWQLGTGSPAGLGSFKVAFLIGNLDQMLKNAMFGKTL